jgi:hypothetical protein
MSVYNRFFGKRESDDSPDDLLAEPKKGEPPALQVLLADGFSLDPAKVTEAMRGYHPSMAKARCDIAGELTPEGKILGLAGWDKHVLQLVGFDVPMPKETVELCVAPSHYGVSLKQQARAHKGHVLLWYAGREASVIDQFVALAALSGVLARFGAIVVLNETAHTSFPAAALSAEDVEGDMIEELRNLPLPVLYCGFVKYDIPNDTHVWMRTFGAHVLDLPDLAAYTNGHNEGQRYFNMFDSIWGYTLNTGKRLGAGHTMQLDANDYFRFRAPTKDEPWLESKGQMLVVEVIREDQINR